jgi:hypothetical protein
MKGFKQYIEEKSPSFGGKDRDKLSLFNIIFIKKSIPITTKTKEIFEPNKYKEYYHITSFNAINQLKKIEGGKKSLSVSAIKPTDHLIKHGITSYFQGALTVLDGTPLLTQSFDIYSEVDQQGRRWVALDNILNVSVSSIFDADSRQIVRKIENDFLNIFEKHFGKDVVDVINRDGWDQHQVLISIDEGEVDNWLEGLGVDIDDKSVQKNIKMFDNDFKKFKGKYYKIWIDFCYSFLKKYDYLIKESLIKKAELKNNNFFYDYAGTGKPYIEWNNTKDATDETILNNIKIKEIHVFSFDIRGITYNMDDFLKGYVSDYNDSDYSTHPPDDKFINNMDLALKHKVKFMDEKGKDVTTKVIKHYNKTYK